MLNLQIINSVTHEKTPYHPACAGAFSLFRGNPVDATGDLWGAYDNGLSNAYFILKAREQGFDTLIMGMRESDSLREVFSIPETEEVMAVISLGKRASEPRRPDRKPIDDIVRFY